MGLGTDVADKRLYKTTASDIFLHPFSSSNRHFASAYLLVYVNILAQKETWIIKEKDICITLGFGGGFTLPQLFLLAKQGYYVQLVWNSDSTAICIWFDYDGLALQTIQWTMDKFRYYWLEELNQQQSPENLSFLVFSFIWKYVEDDKWPQSPQIEMFLLFRLLIFRNLCIRNFRSGTWRIMGQVLPYINSEKDNFWQPCADIPRQGQKKGKGWLKRGKKLMNLLFVNSTIW